MRDSSSVRWLVATIVVIAVASSAFADGAANRLRDIRTLSTGPESSEPNCFVEMGGDIYFVAAHETSGIELWKTDGTSVGTELVRDIYPGPADSWSYPRCLGASGGRVFIRAEDGSNGLELWASDGTAAGTQLVNLQLGGNMDLLDVTEIEELVDLNGSLLVSVQTEETGSELWRVDPLGLSATLVKDIALGDASTAPRLLTRVGNEVFFTAFFPGRRDLWKTDGTELGTQEVFSTLIEISEMAELNGELYFSHGGLWKSDGTTAGTILVRELQTPGSSQINELTPSGGSLYFQGDDGIAGRELWISDGTFAGTQVLDIRPGSASSTPQELIASAGRLFARANDGQLGTELREVNSSPPSQAPIDMVVGPSSSYPTKMTDVGGTVYFSNRDVFNGPFSFWSTSGAADGFTLLQRDLQVTNPFGTETTLYMAADDSATGDGSELWTATGANVSLLKNLNLELGDADPRNITAVGDLTYFTALDDDGATALWKSDGTSDATELVKAILPGGDAQISNATPLGNLLIFSATDGSTAGPDLWRSDGSSSGTLRIKEIQPGGGDPTILGPLTRLNDALLFAANDGASGQELWRTDGTAAGTYLLADINPGPADGLSDSSATFMARLGGALLFSATSELGSELWKTDGTAAGTVLVKDIRPGAIGSVGPGSPERMFVSGGALYFLANGGSGGEPWISDGTEAGTLPLGDLQPGTGGSFPSFIGSTGSAVIFLTGFPGSGQELWRTDGTAAGTLFLKDVELISTAESSIGKSVEFGEQVCFTQDTAAHGIELWCSDGTVAGTKLLKDIYPGIGDGAPEGLQVYNGKLYFSANDNQSGRELWATDGTESGTTRILDLAPGREGSIPTNMFRMIQSNGLMVFLASNGPDGLGIWRSDGTPAGTERIDEIVAGPASFGVPSDLPDPYFHEGQNLVYFSAADLTTGIELWNIPVLSPGAVPGNGAVGTPLTMAKSGSDLQLDWGSAVCGPDADDFAVYSGPLDGGDFSSHSPLTCSTSGLSQYSFQPDSGNEYFLVVSAAVLPTGSLEGSYGRTSAGIERAASISSCRSQVVYESCPE